MEPMNPKQPSTGERGYSMIELVVVVGLIIIMAAVSIPNIAGYIRNYRIRGATQQIAGEIQTARNKAIVKNTNAGVAFAIMDSNSYRYWMLDDNNPPPVPPATTAGLGPLRELPPGVVFVAAAQSGIGFDRLGRSCTLAAIGCSVTAVPTQAELCPTAGELARCTDRVAGNYISIGPNGEFVVTVREEATGQLRTVEVVTGGRVRTQR
jgi:type II secretory pathway pseudopilin PulG